MNKKKFLYLGLSILCNYVLAGFFVLLEFDFFEKGKSVQTKLTAIGLLTLFVLFIKFSKQLANLIKTIKNQVILIILALFKTFAIGLTILFVLNAMEDKIYDLEILTIIFTICFALGNVFHHLFLKQIETDTKTEQDNNFRNIISEELKKMSK